MYDVPCTVEIWMCQPFINSIRWIVCQKRNFQRHRHFPTQNMVIRKRSKHEETQRYQLLEESKDFPMNLDPIHFGLVKNYCIEVVKQKPLKLCVRVSQATPQRKRRSWCNVFRSLPEARWDRFQINPIARDLNELMLAALGYPGSWWRSS